MTALTKAAGFAACISILSAPLALAAAPGGFTKVSGHVLVDSGGAKNEASQDTALNWGDRIIGDPGSSALIHLSSAPDAAGGPAGPPLTASTSNETISLVGPFELTLTAPGAGSPPVLSLLGGKLRMLFNAVAPNAKPVTVLKTRSAVMGVRGTDFFASYEPLLGESEVICFDHEIAFRGSNDKSDVRVKAGHWGGIGGRFGTKIKPPMALPANVLEHFKALLPLN